MRLFLSLLLAGQACWAQNPELKLHRALHAGWNGKAAFTPLIQPANSPAPQERFQELDAASLKAIDRGLQALAKLQHRDGSFGNGTAPVATTAMAGLAFLAGGHTPRRSKYSENVEKIVAYLLKRSERNNGYINEGNGGSKELGNSVLYGHGYSLLFFTQVYGMMEYPSSDDTERIREAISRAVKVIEGAQDKSGGWNYEPGQTGNEGSVTVTQVQALRAARDIGIKVNLETVKKAIEYINKVTSEEGRTSYSLNADGSRSGSESPSLSGAGLCVLAYLGKYESPKIAKGLENLIKDHLPGSKNNGSVSGISSGGWSFFFYSNYYISLAMYHGGDAYWPKWWPAMRKSFLDSQDDETGLWKNAESKSYGEAFGTSLALLTLQIPKRILPIFQRAKD